VVFSSVTGQALPLTLGERGILAQQGPCDPRILCGDGDASAVVTAARLDRLRRARERIGFPDCTLQHGTCTHDEQGS
jgi:hypothetical protein